MAGFVDMVLDTARWLTLGLLSPVRLLDEEARVQHHVACACAEGLGWLVALVAMDVIFRPY